jgi:hypothetical protein
MDDSTAYDRLLDALRGHGGTVTTNGNGKAMAQCPAHDDANPSLRVTEGALNVLVHCHAGCDTKDVLAELDMTQADLFDGNVSYSYRNGRVVTRTPDKQFKQSGNTKDTSLFQAEDIGDAEIVYVTEGEKDAANLAHAYGVAAVSPPCGAGTAAQKWDWTPLSGKHAIVIADKDKTGRKHAEDVAAQLHNVADSVVIAESAVGKDISDHIAAGKKLADLVVSSLLDKLGVTSEWLNTQTFPDLEYVVPSLICEGLGLLVGPPKKGKSFLVGNLAVAVAAGAKALGSIAVKQRPVLVLALEDGHRRLKQRYTNINGGQPIPSGITFINKATPAECIAVIAEYLDLHRDRKPFIILDTLGKVKPPRRSGDEAYQADYALGSQFKSLADSAPGSTILIIHHTRKADATDFIDLVSGTQGLAGSVDYVLALDRKRLCDDAILSVTGRDIIEAEYALVAEDGMFWKLDGADLSTAANAVQERRATEKMGDQKYKVFNYVCKSNDPVTPEQVAKACGMDNNDAGKYLRRLAADNAVTKAGRGKYLANPSSYL